MSIQALIAAFLILTFAACDPTEPPLQDSPDASIDVDEDFVIAPPDTPDPPEPGSIRVERRFPAQAPPPDAFGDCLFASPLAHTDANGDTTIITIASNEVRGQSPDTGELKWRATLPAPDGNLPHAVATPVIVRDDAGGRDLLVVAYHTSVSPAGRNLGRTERFTQYAVVFDLNIGALATDFEPLVLQGEVAANTEGETVPFRPDHALARSALVHAGTGLGIVYVTFGNARDIQPWHGFLFELDMAAWQLEGSASAIREFFTTTPEADCGVEGHSGSRERLCGGGLWAPSGPLLIERGESWELILSPGNGQLDLERRDYANSLLRVRPRESGLAFFEPGCDMALCADFDADWPSLDCIDSCPDLWIPHLEGTAMPESGACDGQAPLECWMTLDYIGGSTPVMVSVPNGPDVLAYPTKDGAIYLIDADHLGTQYDRAQLVQICGTPEDPCRWDWAGMIVTQPALTEVDGDPLVIVPTFMPDNTHPAGVVALKIVMENGAPRFERHWQFPQFDTVEAVQRFRRHSSRVRVSPAQIAGQTVNVAWLVEAQAPGRQARLIGLDTRSGQRLVDEPMAGPGMRFTQPLIFGDTVYVPSCATDDGPGWLEAWDIVASP